MNPPNETLLLVEDNEDDVFLMRRAVKKAELTCLLHVAMDGQHAMDYLEGVGPYRDRAQFPVPDFVFLDLKLPYVHGFEVLTWLREQRSLKDLPVAVLTSSFEDRDRQRARELGARAYLVKPPTPETLRQALLSLKAPATAPGALEIRFPETLSSADRLRTIG